MDDIEYVKVKVDSSQVGPCLMTMTDDDAAKLSKALNHMIADLLDASVCPSCGTYAILAGTLMVIETGYKAHHEKDLPMSRKIELIGAIMKAIGDTFECSIQLSMGDIEKPVTPDEHMKAVVDEYRERASEFADLKKAESDDNGTPQ